MLNKYFDKIYCINLNRRKDRREWAQNHFNFIGIDVEFFEAIDGSLINNTNCLLNKGEIGCMLSHTAVYQKSIKDGVRDYLILEDDCEFHPDVNNLFPIFYQQVPDDWCLLYFGGNHNSIYLNKISENIHRLNRTYTTHCYAVKCGFSEFLIDSMKKKNELLQQVDVELCDIQKIKPCYGIVPHLAWQKEDYSDIQGRVVNYDIFLKH